MEKPENFWMGQGITLSFRYQVIQMLHQRYKKHTLFINEGKDLSEENATRFEGIGC